MVQHVMNVASLYHLAAQLCQTLMQIGKGKVVKVTGIHNKGRTATCLLRGSNKLVLEEAERSLHDALCVVRCLVHKKFLIAGGAAPEVELVTQLSKWAKTLQVSLTYLTVAFFSIWNSLLVRQCA